MTRLFQFASAAFAVVACSQTPSIENLIVYKEAGRYAGWPANHGVWSWGNEILVGFESGVFQYAERMHSIDYNKPQEHLLARSLDGGKTWKIEKHKELIPPPGSKMAGVPAEEGGREPNEFPGSVHFKKPGFVMTWRMTDIHVGPSRFYYSYDRGKSWSGPFKAPDFGTKGIAARTDYVIDGKHEATVFLTASKTNGREGRVLCARTTDGGKTWRQMGWLHAETEGYGIMPSSVRVNRNVILTAVRRQEKGENFIELYRTEDNGANWKLVSVVTARSTANSGNPPSMLRLKDGRLCVTYGHREAPFGIRARMSKDDGVTWEDEIILRADGGNRDLGYPRTVQRPDGKLVTVYYYNDGPDKERYIAATIWDPAAGVDASR